MIRRMQGGPARRHGVRLRGRSGAQPHRQPVVPRHDVGKRRRRTRSASQTRRAPHAAEGIARDQRQHGRAGGAGRRSRPGQGRDRRRGRSCVRVAARRGARPGGLAAGSARRPTRLGRSDIRHPRPAQPAAGSRLAVERADAALRASRRASSQRDRGQPGSRRPGRGRQRKVAPPRLPAADGRLRRSVAGHHDQRDLQCPALVRRLPGAVGDRERQPRSDSQRRQRGHPLRVAGACVLAKSVSRGDNWRHHEFRLGRGSW